MSKEGFYRKAGSSDIPPKKAMRDRTSQPWRGSAVFMNKGIHRDMTIPAQAGILGF